MADNDLTTTAKALINVNQRLQKVEKGGSTGGSDTGGGNTPVDPTVPDSGVNVDPGKSLTNQKQVWTGGTTPNQDTTLQLDKSINANLDNVGDGLQFIFKITKTPFVTGVQGAASDLVPVASTSTTPVSGQYICSVPVPISIKKGSFVAGTKLSVPIKGIGEGLPNITKTVPPLVELTLNGNGSILAHTTQGYAFDKLGEGNSGAQYDVIITAVKTYTVGAPIVPLASGTVLWSGSQSANGTIALDSRLNKDYSNVGGGIKIKTGSFSFDPYSKFSNTPPTSKRYIPAANMPFVPATQATKDQLTVGNKLVFSTNTGTAQVNAGDSPDGTTSGSATTMENPVVLTITVNEGALGVQITPGSTGEMSMSSMVAKNTVVPIISITTY